MRTLERREKKLIALLIAVALVSTLWLVVIAPVAGGFIERAQERDDLRTEYARDMRLSAAYPTWRAEMDAQTASRDDYAIGAATQSLATGTLTTHVKQLVLESGGTVKSIQPLEGASQDEVRIRANLQLTMEQLYRTLKKIETGVPYVVVEYFSIAADSAVQSGRLGPMDVRLDISAKSRTTDAQSQ
jgi:Tfp pilus assembly protein PilO